MTDVEFNLIAYDEASSVVESFGATMSSTFQNVEAETQNLASTTEQATSQIQSDYEDAAFSVKAMEDAQGGASQSFSTSAKEMNNLALAGAGLYMSFERVENAQVALDRANLMVQRSTLALEKAQTAYTDAVAKFGADSPEAQSALEKLNIAQTALQVSQERADMSTRNMNNAMLTSALTVIPSLIAIIGTLSAMQEAGTLAKIASTAASWAHAAAEQAETAATYLASGAMAIFNAVMDANPITIVIIAIAALVAGILVLWNYCPPFRDAILTVAGALGGALSVAATAITQALTWFWQNVLVPLGQYIVSVFVVYLNTIGTVFQALGATWNAVCTAISNAWNWLVNGIMTVWNAVGAPLIGAIQGFIDAVKAAFDFLFGWLIGGSLWPDLCGGLLSIWNNVVGPLIGIIQGFVQAVVGFFQDLASGLTDVWNGIVSGISGAVNSVGSTLSSWGTSISDWASGVAGTIGGALGSVASTVTNGLTAAGTAVGNAVGAVASDAGSVIGTVTGAVSGGLGAMGTAVGTAANAVGTAMGTVATAVQGGLASAGSAIQNFIGSICFAHALQGAADSSARTMSGWTDMIGRSMDKGLGEIKDFNAEVGVAGMAGGSSIALGSAPLQGLAPAGRGQVSIQITAPLVNIEGSADKATVDLAAKQVLGQLKTVIVEPTSYGASSTQKRIRKGSLNIA